MRFEPGQKKTVSLVSIGGNRVIRGGNNLCAGQVNKLDGGVLDAIMDKMLEQGFQHEPLPERGDDTAATDSSRVGSSNGDGNSAANGDDRGSCSAAKRRKLSSYSYEGLPISRDLYARMYGPTTGDVVRLADTHLYIRVEADRTVYGDELKFGGGKVLRDGMGQAAGLLPEQQLDTVITNALIVDHKGIYKADVGIKAGRIAGIGRAGNPDTMEGVDDGMWCGANTDVIAVSPVMLH